MLPYNAIIIFLFEDMFAAGAMYCAPTELYFDKNA